jgi:hypothetical protein
LLSVSTFRIVADSAVATFQPVLRVLFMPLNLVSTRAPRMRRFKTRIFEEDGSRFREPIRKMEREKEEVRDARSHGLKV